MIAVIADDFTGAAEIGGIGLRHGLKVIIETSVSGPVDADLLVIATDTRSMPGEIAKKEIEKVTRQLLSLSPKYIFKKLDSVLRGNIYDELIGQQTVSKKKRVLIVPANPHFDRIIENGIYYVSGIPLSETSFINDPEFPVKYSHVKKIIGGDPEKLFSLDVHDPLPEEGIIIGNVVDEQDLNAWADKSDDQSVLGGGAGFFSALLQKEFPLNCQQFGKLFKSGSNALYIMGSTFPKGDGMMKKFGQAGIEMVNLPAALWDEKNKALEVLKCAEKIVKGIHANGLVVISTIYPDLMEEFPALTIRKVMGQLVKEVFKLVRIDDLFIEGGATAFQILNDLNIRKLIPFREIDFGIIQMRVENDPNLCVTTKPGSYVWPDFLIDKRNN